MKFFNFLNLFAIFLSIFFPRFGRNEIRDEIFFIPFLGLSQLGLDRNIAGMMLFFFFFFNFLNILAIFSLEFSSPGRVEMKFGTKFFFLFLGLSQPNLDRNNARMMFFNFLNFLAIFLRIFLPEVGRNRIQDENFFLFLGLAQPGLDRNIPRMVFLNFFCCFFENFLAWVK